MQIWQALGYFFRAGIPNAQLGYTLAPLPGQQPVVGWPRTVTYPSASSALLQHGCDTQLGGMERPDSTILLKSVCNPEQSSQVLDSWFLPDVCYPALSQNRPVVFLSPAPPPSHTALRDTHIWAPHSTQALAPRPSPKCCEHSGLPIQTSSSCESKYLQILSDCHSDSLKR